jgi:ribonuclease Y
LPAPRLLPEPWPTPINRRCKVNVLFVALALIIGGVIGYIGRNLVAKNIIGTAEDKASQIVKKAETKLREAETQAKEVVIEAKEKVNELKERLEQESEKRRSEILDFEKRLLARDETLDQKTKDLEAKAEKVTRDAEELETLKQKIHEIKAMQEERLEKVAKMTRDEAKEFLLSRIEKDYKDELVKKVHEMEALIKETADAKARDILATAIARYASEVSTESTTKTVALPSDELKGRVIGKEGRNIHAFEHITGVDLIIDDTPGAITISTFDPVRREIAVRTMEKLIADGRIQPSRIEEIYNRTKLELDDEMKKAGEQALIELNLGTLQPDLVRTIGRLKYRTSYGQNILQHSIEAAHIAGMLASEIKADVQMAKLAALLHDIGKALDHEHEGTHIELSKQIAVKYNLPEVVAHALEVSHEDEGGPTSAIDFITIASDAISAARPGARRETAEQFVKRLSELENIARDFEGVDEVFAIQAGREVRIMVVPEEVDDLQAIKLAKGVAERFEKELTYPGQIKVNVIRETRAESIAK